MSAAPQDNNVIDAELVGDAVTTTALEAITRAEVDITIATAKRYPRSVTKFKNTAIAMATQTEEIAAACFYTLKRKNADGSYNQIEGPGIRLAEICGSTYGNIRFGGRIINDDGRFITAQGLCFDVENNVSTSVEVKRRVTNKFGKRYSDDMIATTAQAAISIAIRNAIFRVVPRAYVEEIMAAAKKVAVGDVATLTKRVGRVLEWTRKLGVSDEQVLAAIGKTEIAQINVADLEQLTGWRTAIKDGEAKIDEIFPLPAPEPVVSAGADGAPAADKASAIANRLRDRRKASEAVATPESSPEPPNGPAPADEMGKAVTELVDLGRVTFRSKAEGDVEVSAATGGRFKSVEDLVEHGSLDDIRAVITHFKAIK